MGTRQGDPILTARQLTWMKSIALILTVLLPTVNTHPHPHPTWKQFETKWWSKYLPDQADCGVPVIPPNLKVARTVGGREAVAGSWPWNAQVVFERGGQCGAMVISRDWLLTAAHCFSGLGLMNREAANCGILSVVVGVHDTFQHNKTSLRDNEQRLWVSDVITHPQFMADTYENDIALLRVESPLEFNQVVQPICLPSPQKRYFKARDVCVGTGWGDTGSPKDPAPANDIVSPGMVTPESTPAPPPRLNQVVLPLLGDKECKKLTFEGLEVDTRKMVCAGQPGMDTCKGDSGGPLACRSSSKKIKGERWFAYGITSFGERNEPCTGSVGVYTRVYEYRNWIRDTVRRHEPGVSRTCRLPQGLVDEFKAQA